MDSSSGSTDAEEHRIRGIAVSRGVAVGSLQFQGRRFERPRTWPIEEGQVQSDEVRFRAALKETQGQIESLKKELIERGADHSEARIFDAHLMVLEDQVVNDEVLKRLQEEQLNVESVYYKVIRHYVDSLRGVDDPYLRERAIDIEDVAGRVLMNLADEDSNAVPAETHVLFAKDLTPSDTVGLDRSLLLGFATQLGSFTSHTAIMARALGIPGVVGLEIPLGLMRAGIQVILDGYNGLLIINPTKETRKDYERLSAQQDVLNERLEELREEPAKTADGKSVILSGNIEFGHEVDLVKRRGAKGVGLYRTPISSTQMGVTRNRIRFSVGGVSE
jgi:phosphotransferase system enzyme I (PtsI)